MNNLIKLLFVIGILFSAGQISAQDVDGMTEPEVQISDNMDISAAISEVANGINPDAFNRNFDMTEWQAKLPELNLDDVSGIKKSLNSLIDGLKSSAFIKGAKAGVVRNLIGMNGKADIPKVLTSLLNGLKPDMLTKEFAVNKDDFLEALKMMK